MSSKYNTASHHTHIYIAEKYMHKEQVLDNTTASDKIMIMTNRPLLFISLSHSDNQSELTMSMKFYKSFKADVGRMC